MDGEVVATMSGRQMDKGLMCIRGCWSREPQCATWTHAGAYYRQQITIVTLSDNPSTCSQRVVGKSRKIVEDTHRGLQCLTTEKSKWHTPEEEKQNAS